jgi:hypothetical protein
MKNDDNNDERSNAHPLQGYITNFIPIAGKMGTFILVALTMFSVYLVNSSAATIHEFLGVVSLFVTMIALLGLGYISLLIRRSRITVTTRSSGKRPLDSFTPIYLLLVFCGFIQTFFWVIDPEDNIHEPRSVFIIAVAGAFAYFRHQYLTNSVLQAAGDNNE